MKNTRLTTGPAASALGTKVLMPTPSAVKHSMPDHDHEHERGHVLRPVHVVAEATDQQDQDDLDQRR